jgi:hypothetical protein
MRAATVAAGEARWVWAGAAMRCDAMRRADGRCWLGRFGRAGSVWTAAEDAGAAAQCRRQRTRRIEGSRGSIDSIDSITEESRAWLAADVGDRLGVGGRSVESRCRCTQARRITTTRLSVPTRRPSGSLPARRPAASENQCDARCATAPAPPFPAHAASASVACHLRRLRGSRAARRHALAEPPPAHSWPAAAETAPEAGSGSGPRLPTHAALRVHLA